MSLKYKALRFASRKNMTKLGFLAGGAIAGSVVGNRLAQPGMRGEASREGAVIGATVGALPIVGKPIAKIIGRGLAATPGLRAPIAKAKVVFRRFRGRIVPIKVK